MARISVVVPVYNVEEYLRECLDSVIAQSFKDLEVVLVDDGATDGSVAICEEYVAKDERFKLVRQANAGLGAARNTGAREASGEFLAFLDSDDALPKHALRTLLRSLDRTGSDFATGNVFRFSRGDSSQAPFVAKVFTRSRPKTHITKFRTLLVDRIAPNKLFRRSFWDRHQFRFPEGMTHEDIPVIVPAHFLARSVDVIAEPTYLYRVREAGGLSITQRRLEQKVLMDRLAAVTYVSNFLGKHRRRAKRWYDASVVAEDLRYYLNVLPHADDAYKALFAHEVNRFLDTISPKAFEPLMAIERVKWALVRRRRLEEVLEVIHFQRTQLDETVPVEIDGRFYGDYPYLDDPEVGVPRSAYELRQELALAARLDSVRWEDDVAHIRGSAFITAIGAPEPSAQRLEIVALRAGKYRWWRRVRRRVPWLGIRVRTEAEQRPALTADTRQRLVDVRWAGFHAKVSAAQLERFRFGRSEAWELYADVHTGKVSRRTVRFVPSSARPVRAADLRRPSGALLRVGPDYGRKLNIDLLQRWAVVTDHAFVDGQIELRGDLRGYEGKLTLELLREEGLPTLEYPLEVSGERFTVRLPPDAVVQPVEEDARVGDVEDEETEQGVRWQLMLLAGRRKDKVWLAEDAPIAAWPATGAEVALHRSFTGHAALVARPAEPVATELEWLPDGRLRVSGELGVWSGPLELVLHGPKSRATFAWPAQTGEGRFSGELAPYAIETAGGPVPLRQGAWHICARADASAALVPVVVARPLLRELPPPTVHAHKQMSLGAMAGDRALLSVGRDLDDDERGTFHQRRLARTAYAARREEPLREAVVYTTYGGRQCSDSPRAIHAELVRRGTPVEHLWVVHDGMAHPPAGSAALRSGSREHLEALATARYIVANDHLPDLFERRPDQVVLQTWHGTPMKRLGTDVASRAPTQRRFEVGAAGETAQWQHVLSPNAFSTPILRRGLGVAGAIHETGYPRNDVLAAAGREERAAAVRERLGLEAGARVVLYAPTFRDHVIDRRGRPRLDLHLDVARLRERLGGDTVVLFRKHHLVPDPVPATSDGFVRDVSAYPDASELLLAADVLVSDYSALVFDYAITGRPIVLFAYDLETYRDDVRGFYVDPVTEVPAPLVRTTDELADALNEIDTLHAGLADRYHAFAERFCAIEDGHAAARAADLLFSVADS